MNPRRKISEKEREKRQKESLYREDLIKWGMNSTRQTVDSLTLIMSVLVFFSLPFPFLSLFLLFTYHEIPLYLYI